MRSAEGLNARLAGDNARADFVSMRGWERAKAQSLPDALQSVISAGLVENLLEYVQDAVEFAERYLRNHGGRDPHGLSLHQIAALNLYTKENRYRHEQSFYAVLNKKLNSKQRREIVAFFGYLNLFVEGARLLPNACHGGLSLWRAFPNLDPEWRSLYAIGQELFWWAFTSTTKNDDVLKNPQFFGGRGERTLFSLHCVSGIEITAYSDFPEDEILVRRPNHLKKPALEAAAALRLEDL